MLLDTAASEAAFLRNCANADVIYIASHGDKGTVKDEIEHELLLAGQSLLLAADGSGETDGVLTAADITGLPLDHVRLVVLSACESAQGMQFEGEGAFSLRKAFQMAGVSTVISTLWQVDDPSTAELMSIVFVNDQSSIAVALQEAMNDRIRMLRGSGSPLGDHPYLWAGIVASGDWRFAQ